MAKWIIFFALGGLEGHATHASVNWPRAHKYNPLSHISSFVFISKQSPKLLKLDRYNI